MFALAVVVFGLPHPTAADLSRHTPPTGDAAVTRGDAAPAAPALHLVTTAPGGHALRPAQPTAAPPAQGLPVPLRATAGDQVTASAIPFPSAPPPLRVLHCTWQI